MTLINLIETWAHGPTFYPRELAESMGIRPIIAEQLCKKLRLNRIKCAVGRMYQSAELLVALQKKQYLFEWALAQNEVQNIGETQLTLELGSSFPPYYTADPKP